MTHTAIQLVEKAGNDRRPPRFTLLSKWRELRLSSHNLPVQNLFRGLVER